MANNDGSDAGAGLPFELESAAARKVLNVVYAVRELVADKEALGALERLAGASLAGGATAPDFSAASPGPERSTGALRPKRPKRNPNPCGYCSFYKQRCELVTGVKGLCMKCRDMGRQTCYPKKNLPGPDMYPEDANSTMAVAPAPTHAHASAQGLAVPPRTRSARGSASPASSVSHQRGGSGDSNTGHPGHSHSTYAYELYGPGHPGVPIHHPAPGMGGSGSGVGGGSGSALGMHIDVGSDFQQQSNYTLGLSAAEHGGAGMQQVFSQQAQTYYSPSSQSLTPISVASSASGGSTNHLWQPYLDREYGSADMAS